MRSLPILFAMIMLIAGCGRKGPLIYLDMLVPEAPSAVLARQAGPGMKLSFVLPKKDLAGQNLRNLSGFNILKRETTPVIGEECDTCKEPFRLFRKLYIDFQDESVRRYGSLMILMDSDVRIGSVYTYKVVPFTRDSLAGAAAAPVSAAMLQPPAPPVLRAVPSPTDIKLEFTGVAPLTGVLEGYNLFRAGKDEPMPFLPLNKLPLPGTTHTDSGLERGETYSYGARSVVRMPSGEIVESALSNIVEGALRDEE
jgi:hypothetical protein